ncbi:unnamed protein product [marine sediment metagenome]|uniref:Uncharacterized protein n=1 Tax=marine sediment metagenome TaxID=412755 RepID=X1QZF1_9ZZZZ
MSGICRERGESLKTLPDFPRTNLNQAIWETIRKDPNTGKISIDHDFVNDYLDCIAKLFPDEAKSYLPFLPKKCGQWAKIGQCENGHRFAVKINCRKPWCDVCGDIEHHKKIASLLPEVQQLLPAGYWVIRPPNELQVFEMNRYERRRFIKAVIRALKSLGYRRGIIVIHYFGDDPTKYAFHLNVLVDGGYLEPEQLDELKRKLRRKIYPRWVIRKWGDKLDIFYEYLPTQGQVYHALEYCTRPTFTQLAGNERLADSIRGEHTIRRWGKWDEEPKWHLDDTGKKLQSLVSLEKGKCPECGSPITWDKPLVPLALALAQGGTEITAGYYALSPIRPPPAVPVRPTNLIELPDDDYCKHSNVVRRLIDRARERVSFYGDYESYS